LLSIEEAYYVPETAKSEIPTKHQKEHEMNRRKWLKIAGGAVATGAIGVLTEQDEALAQTYSNATRGLPALKITNVKTIKTCPQGGNYVVIKVETSEPGLYGVGSATLTTRGEAVATAATEFLAPFAIGRDPDNIEDMWQTAYVSSYWRNGPVLNGALCGLDEALWDIKAKRANMPLYQLLGARVVLPFPPIVTPMARRSKRHQIMSVNSWKRAGSMCVFSSEGMVRRSLGRHLISKEPDSVCLQTSIRITSRM